jgi:hypothetical protein
VLTAGLCVGLAILTVSRARAQADVYIPATRAFESPGCNPSDITDSHDLSRGDPEWKPIVIDANHPLPNNPPSIVEGWVATVPPDENQDSQAPAEVSEEELPWNHYTHD